MSPAVTWAKRRIDLRLAYNGRNDVSYAVAINYDETLEDYVTISLPEENLASHD